MSTATIETVTVPVADLGPVLAIAKLCRFDTAAYYGIERAMGPWMGPVDIEGEVVEVAVGDLWRLVESVTNVLVGEHFCGDEEFIFRPLEKLLSWAADTPIASREYLDYVTLALSGGSLNKPAGRAAEALADETYGVVR